MAEDPTVLAPITVTAPPRGSKREPAGIRPFSPKCSVILHKNIGRATAGGDIAASERFKGSKHEIDLTPFLGTMGEVIVTKSVRTPEGMWSVTFADRKSSDLSDSIYGLVEPLDTIEIRMARDTSIYAGVYDRNMPVMMRGFVSAITRGRVMTDRGPQRTVTISGQDYGKVLQMMRITYLPGMVLGQDLLTSYKAFVNYGLAFTLNQDAADFIRNVMTSCVDPFLARMKEKANNGQPSVDSPVLGIQVEAINGSGIVSPFGVQDWPGGTVYDLLNYFGDVGAWNELFIEDREDGPWLVYRPLPFRNLKGDLIQDTAIDPGTIDVYDNMIIDEAPLERTDANVANYFWVDAPRFNLIDGSIIQAASAGDGTADWFIRDYPNCSPDLYGIRLMQVTTQQGQRLDGQPEDVLDKGRSDALSWLKEKRRILIENNRDNVVFESGTMTMRGEEKVRAGKYLNIKRGSSSVTDSPGLASTAYAHTVRHTYQVGRNFLTHVDYDRGTSFVERIQKGSASDTPYNLEMTLGGAYGV